MQLIITEKPSVARDIAKVLKVQNKKQGYFEGNNYLISWAFGHLIQLVHAHHYNPEFEKWNIDHLPIIPDKFETEVSKDDGAKSQFNTIKTLMNDDKTTEIICATDAGREGELIFRHIYNKAGCTKPIKRLWISSQTDKAIKEGFDKLKDGNKYNTLYDSALSRSEADWLIGINATRAYTRKFSFGKGVMSVGRVQTPVLKLIVDRYQAHVGFKPETYYEVHAELTHENGSFAAIWINDKKESRLTVEDDAKVIIDDLKNAGNGIVESLAKKEISENPPLLYDLTELQKDSNKKFKFSADKTLKIAQSLYERHKILTYPRTSSRYLSSDIKPKVKNLIQNVSNIPDIGPFATKILEKELSYSKRLFDDKKVTDHHAIIPTDKKPDVSQLSADERLVYELVIKRFLAGFMDNCQKESTEIISRVGIHALKSNGTIIRQLGWREIYQHDEKDTEKESKSKKKKKDEPELLPAVNENDPIDVSKCEHLKKQTKAPPLYTEASILAAMETAGKTIDDEDMRQAMKDCGLGTPATRAQILERLLKVQYIERQKNALIPTDKGIELISLIQTNELLSPELTGEMEQKLNQIVSGDYTRDTYMTETKEFAKRVIDEVKAAKNISSFKPKDALGECPLCQGGVVETKMAFSCTMWKQTGCKFAIWKTIAKKKISESMAKTLLKEGKTKLLKGFKSRAGKDFHAMLKLDKEQGKVVFEFEPRS